MMKKLLIALLITVVFTSCTNNTSIEVVTFSISDQPCEACARVEIQYPLTPGKNRKQRKINAALDQWVIQAIDLSPENSSASVEEAVSEFKEAYQRIKSDFPDEYDLNWESTVNGEVCYENNQLIAICMETYSYTGGAHGYGSSHYLLFNKKEGEVVKKEDLLKDENGFLTLVESEFRKKFNITNNRPLNEQGFMFEGDRFHLPNNIGYTHTGLKLIYNPYEIAPYSEGKIVLEIPYQQANKFLTYQVPSNL